MDAELAAPAAVATLVYVTDGGGGWEAQLAARLPRPGWVVHGVGLGYGTSRAALRQLAGADGLVEQFALPAAALERALAAFAGRLGAPVLTDLELVWLDPPAAVVAARRSRLHADEPLYWMARFTGPGIYRYRLRGRAAAGKVRLEGAVSVTAGPHWR